MSRVRLYIQWYKKLRKDGYGIFTSLGSAVYNSKYYTTDGKYL